MFQYDVADFTWKFCGGFGLCMIANPLFFLISGFFLVGGATNVVDILIKLKKRMRTIVIPYVLWNVIFVLWYVVLAVIPGLERFNNSIGVLDVWLKKPVWENVVNMLTGPAAFHLWFLRDLIWFMAVSPLLWWISRKSWVTAIVLSIIVNVWMPWIFWFWLGITISCQKWDTEKIPVNRWMFVMAGCVYVGYSLLSAFGLRDSLPDTFGLIGLAVVASSIYFVWILYDLLACRRCLSEVGIWRHICGYSFFIYCFHEPAFNIIKKLGLVVFGSSEPVLIILYLVNPLIMVGLAIFVSKFMQKVRLFVPVYKVLIGGR